MFGKSKIGKANLRKAFKNTKKITKENGFLVFPFELVSGYITSTENGLRKGENLISDYSSFERVFTGLDNVLAKWDGAYSVEKKDPADTFLTKTYNVGRSILGYITDESITVNFNPSPISTDFLDEYTEENFIMHTYSEISNEDLFKLYISPQLKANKWLYISEATKYYVNGVFHHTEINYKSLNNTIAKSGRAVEQFVQRSAPGEGYAWPLIDEDLNITIDIPRSRDVPIQAMQVEYSGAGAISTVFNYGRPVETETINGVISTKFNEKIQAPRLLMSYTMLTPEPSPANTRPNAETDYLVSFEGAPTLITNFSNWKQKMQNQYDYEMQGKYQGQIGLGSYANLLNTNPLNGSTHSHIITDSNWEIKPWLTAIYSAETDSLSSGNLTFSKDKKYKVYDIMNYNIAITSKFMSLPMNEQENTSWNLSDIPLIGGFLSKITLGIPIGWKDSDYRVVNEKLVLILPASVVEYGNTLLGGTSTESNVFNELNLYQQQNKSDNIELSGINATGTIIKVGITDRFSVLVGGVKHIFNTKDLGQPMPALDDDGVAVAGATGTLLLTDGFKAEPPKKGVPGYVIDSHGHRILCQSDYRLTYFANEFEAWSGTYQSMSKFTGSIRDWTNIIKMSDWNEDTGQVVSYPGSITSPTPDSTLKFDTTLPSLQMGFVERPSWDKLTENGYGLIDFKNRVEILTLTDKTISGQVSSSYDLTPLGGLTAVKNNYDRINFALHKYNANDQGNHNHFVSIPTSELSGAEKVAYTDTDFNVLLGVQWESKAVAGFSGQTYSASGAGAGSYEMTYKMDGNKIVFTIKWTIDFKWTQKPGSSNDWSFNPVAGNGTRWGGWGAKIFLIDPILKV